MLRKLLAGLLSSVLLAGCGHQPPMPRLQPPFLQAFAIPQSSSDRYLCAIGKQDGDNAILKIMDLHTKAIRTLFVPGIVQNMAGIHESQKLFIRSRKASQQNDFLYEVDVRQGSIHYALAFSQVGIQPSDFLVDNEKIYVAGQRGDVGALFSYDLANKSWQPLVYNISSGLLEWGTQISDLQVLHFGEEKLTRTTINIPDRKVTSVYTFEHDVPFGNNLGVASPHGFFFYTFHQLKGQLALFAHDMENGVSTNLLEPALQNGILYSSVISKNGRYLYAAIDNSIQRYELRGTKLTKLPPIALEQSEARYMALSNDDRTLFISHDGNNRVTRIRFHPGFMSYDIDYMAFPGENHDLVVF